MLSADAKPKRVTTAVVLAAGYATRLYPLTLHIPKPLLYVRRGQTVIDFIVDNLKQDVCCGRGFSLREIVVVTNSKFYAAFSSWAAGRRTCAPLVILDDRTRSNDDRLGAVGDIHFAVRRRNIRDDLLVVGGDNLFDRGFGRFLDFAARHSPHPSLGLFDLGSRTEAARFGVVTLAADGHLDTFEEKPAHPKSSLVATCLYYFPRRTLPLLQRYVADRSTSKDAPGSYIRWLKEREAVYGMALEKGHWHDIGHLDSYKEVVANYCTV